MQQKWMGPVWSHTEKFYCHETMWVYVRKVLSLENDDWQTWAGCGMDMPC